jgi:hypothetical protein
LTSASLEMIERFFLDRGAPVDHEISPFAGAAAIRLLCARRYLPIEVSNVLYRTVEQPRDAEIADIRVRTIGRKNRNSGQVTASGWAQEHPELLDFLRRSLGELNGLTNVAIKFHPAI